MQDLGNLDEPQPCTLGRRAHALQILVRHFCSCDYHSHCQRASEQTKDICFANSKCPGIALRLSVTSETDASNLHAALSAASICDGGRVALSRGDPKTKIDCWGM